MSALPFSGWSQIQFSSGITVSDAADLDGRLYEMLTLVHEQQTSPPAIPAGCTIDANDSDAVKVVKHQCNVRLWIRLIEILLTEPESQWEDLFDDAKEDNDACCANASA